MEVKTEKAIAAYEIQIMEVKTEMAIAAYEAARKQGACSVMQVLEQLFDKKTFKPQKVTERVKTFEDALQELGDAHPFVRAYNSWENWGMKGQPDVDAYLKLRIITAALNESWEPQFTQDEWRWFPWFCLWTDEELEKKSDEWKASHSLIDLDGFKGEWAGFAFATSYNAPSSTAAYIGSHLCYQSEALADYSGRQFTDLWADFYLIRK